MNLELLVETLRTEIKLVRNLEVVADYVARSVIIRGRTTSYYNKQMAQQVVMSQRFNNDRVWIKITNEVEVESN